MNEQHQPMRRRVRLECSATFSVLDVKEPLGGHQLIGFTVFARREEELLLLGVTVGVHVARVLPECTNKEESGDEEEEGWSLVLCRS